MSDNLRVFRLFNLITGMIGLLLFLLVFGIARFAPADFDVKVRDFAIGQVNQRVERQLDESEVDSVLSSAESIAGRFSSRLEDRIASARLALDAGLPEFVANIVSQVCDYDCERSAEVEAAITEFFEAQIERYGVSLERLRSFVAGAYEEVVSALRDDVAIFSAVNAIAMALVVLLSIFKGRAAAHLLPFASLLVLGTLLAAAWYVFGQNWLLTILFNDYWGWGYAGLMSIIIMFLLDIAFLKATVTSTVLNVLGGALDGVNFSPC